MKEGGFNVVIGNPPYVRQETIKDEKDYLKEKYKVYDPVADLFVYFIERGLSCLKEGGLFSFIVSSKFVKARYGKPLREFILKNCTIEQFIDFGDLPVFQEATTYPCIIVLKKENDEKIRDRHKVKYTKVKNLNFSNLQKYVDDNFIFVPQKSLHHTEWFFVDPEILRLRQKIERVGVPLREYCGKAYYGIKTGLDNVLIVDKKKKEEIIKENTKEAELFLPIIEGKDVHRWGIRLREKYLIFTEDKIIENYPNTFSYLKNHREALLKRSDLKNKRRWYGLRSCKYYNKIREPKIVYPEVSNRLNFTLDEDGVFIKKTVFFLSTSDKYLLGILNSKLMLFYLHFISSVMRGGYYMFSSIYVERFPIKKASEQHQKPIIKLAEKQLALTKQLNEIGDKKTDERQRIEEEINKTDAEIDELVYKLYDITESEKKIIEESL